MSYHDILASKRVAFEPKGLGKVPALNAALFPHQRDVVEFLLRSGCGAAFLDTGLGKTFVSLEWGRCIVEATNKPVLMLAPLAVGPQHEKEARERDIDAVHVREKRGTLGKRIYITNYENLHKFDAGDFAGVILDESSILKSFSGATSRALIDAFARTPYRLAATATPAPNDHTELGQHTAMLGIMQAREMLSRWFINDTSTASQDWRLKGHAVESFWDFVASWARCVSKPSDLGHDDARFVLPELVRHDHIVQADRSTDVGEEKSGQVRLFRMPEMSATSIHREKSLTLAARADVIAERVSDEPGEPWILWCDTNDEADALMARIPGAIEVRGSMSADQKERRLVDFSEGRERYLITKPSIAGFGLNWQHCARVGFAGLSFSYESYYQAVRRCWRFGQRRPVHVHVAMADTERVIAETVLRKSEDHDVMRAAMTAAMARACKRVPATVSYQPTRRVAVPGWMQQAA